MGDISWIKGANSQRLQLDIDAHSKNEQRGTQSVPTVAGLRIDVDSPD